LEHLLVLSHVDVAGDCDTTFSERDLEVGQGFSDVDQEERYRAERIYRRFADQLPLTVARCGWIPGNGGEACPLVHLLLAISDDLGRDGERPLVIAEAHALAALLAGLFGAPPSRGGRTLHLFDPKQRTAADLGAVVRRQTRDLVPRGYDLSAGARRLLRRGWQAHDWSYREFFRRQPGGARFESAWTEQLLTEHGLRVPALEDEHIAELVEGAVEEIVGFK
jgi:hypothetical protein